MGPAGRTLPATWGTGPARCTQVRTCQGGLGPGPKFPRHLPRSPELAQRPQAAWPRSSVQAPVPPRGEEQEARGEARPAQPLPPSRGLVRAQRRTPAFPSRRRRPAVEPLHREGPEWPRAPLASTRAGAEQRRPPPPSHVPGLPQRPDPSRPPETASPGRAAFVGPGPGVGAGAPPPTGALRPEPAPGPAAPRTWTRQLAATQSAESSWRSEGRRCVSLAPSRQRWRYLNRSHPRAATPHGLTAWLRRPGQ